MTRKHIDHIPENSFRFLTFRASPYRVATLRGSLSVGLVAVPLVSNGTATRLAPSRCSIHCNETTPPLHIADASCDLSQVPGDTDSFPIPNRQQSTLPYYSLASIKYQNQAISSTPNPRTRPKAIQFEKNKDQPKTTSWSIRPSLPYILAFCLVLVLSSCEKVFLGADRANTAVENFEYLWQDVQERYTFFDLKGIHWDSIYDAYLIKVQQTQNERQLFDTLAAMLNLLEDGHVNLVSSFNRSRNWDWFLNFPPNFNYETVRRQYLGKDFLFTGPLQNQIIDSILYIYYDSFGQLIRDEHLQSILARSSSCKGIILDIRNNGGGSLGNAYALASIFTPEPITFARERTKNGPGPQDFSPWRNLSIRPSTLGICDKPMILLTNRACYSASTFFAQMIKSIPQASILGDQTGGGGGIPASGQLPNGWTYRLSVTQSEDLTGYPLELGVIPDISLQTTPEDEAAQRDTYIEMALFLLRQI